MEDLARHEIFEIELLEYLKNGKFLNPVVFTGGTMLRLCHEINRYSNDLDFWFYKKCDQNDYFKRIKKYLKGLYELTDAAVKFNTMLLEVRSRLYPRRLKIEIRKEIKKCESEQGIAFSKFSTRQVILRVHTLRQVMRNKIEAALSRKDIRDFFDIEFLLRRGVTFDAPAATFAALNSIIGQFKDKDFRVTLGSVLSNREREYYLKNKFNFLKEKIEEKLSF